MPYRAVPYRPFTPTLPALPVGARTRGRLFWQRHSEEVFDYYFGSSLAGMNRRWHLQLHSDISSPKCSFSGEGVSGSEEQAWRQRQKLLDLHSAPTQSGLKSVIGEKKVTRKIKMKSAGEVISHRCAFNPGYFWLWLIKKDHSRRHTFNVTSCHVAGIFIVLNSAS